MLKIRTSDIINDLESCDIGGIDLGRIKNNDINRKILDKKWVAVDDVIKIVERLKAKFDSRKVDHTTSRKREIKSLKRLIVLAFQELQPTHKEGKKWR